ncbi:MAG: DNA primase large subunit PriL [Candidatus Bathyarchaeia archaeon]
MRFTQTDLVKYPFLPQAQDYIRQLNLTVQELTETPSIIKHAEQRVAASFETATPLQPLSAHSASPEIEITSFPVATMLVAAIGDRYLKKRYALHEAKRVYENLGQEPPEKLREIAHFFAWNLTLTDTGAYGLHFADYLQNSTTLQDPEWKLVNRRLSRGRVPITQHEAARLLQEEVRRHIEAKLEAKVTSLPPQIRETVEKLKNTFTARKGAIRLEEIPQTVDPEAFPPCIKALYNALSNGHHLSHTGRFTLTTFLVNIGMPTEAVLDLYRNVSDFNERLTRYQVEHIAGERGSRTRYQPPTCQTLRTHGVCTSPDETCKKAYRPLTCYKRKLAK